MSTHQEAINVFIVYDQNDEKLLRELEKHLSVLKNQGVISIWHRQKIAPGTNVGEVIDEQLKSASIILLLTSANFLASHDSSQIEMKYVLEQHKTSRVQVIPIILRSCDWSHASFGYLQSLPRGGKPITTWGNRDNAWNDVIIGIREAIENLRQGNVIIEPLSEPYEHSSSNRAESSEDRDIARTRNPQFSGDDGLLDQHHPSDTPSSIRHIHIEHAQGPILGDHAHIEQHFYSKSQHTSKDKNRQTMIKRVRATWIQGLLEPSLSSAPLLEVGLQERLDLVSNTWRSVVQEMEQSYPSSSQELSIIKVYDQAQGELLILGEPGTGKTTLLLELARVLLDRAERDENLSIPVIFHLSSWAKKRLPIMDWLIEELHTMYQIPYKVSRTWIHEEKVLPLFDGLDEMHSSHIEACVTAINTYRKEHGLVSTVVCSRQAEYTTQKGRLLLRRAIIIQPLTDEQIDTYLSNRPEQTEGIQKAIHSDHELRELTTTPLILDILVRTYQGTDLKLSKAGPLKERGEQLLATYIERMLQRRGKTTRYSHDQTKGWLAWLARQMLLHEQTEFYLERIQPDWLPKRWMYRLYHVLLRIPFGLFILFASFFIGAILGVVLGTPIGRIIGGEFGANIGQTLGGGISAYGGSLCVLWIFIVISWKQKIEIRPVDVTTWSWKRALQGFLIAFVGDFILEFIYWVSHTDVSVGSVTTLGKFLLTVGIAWWATSTEPRDLISWSWKRAKQAGTLVLIGSILVYSLTDTISSLITTLEATFFREVIYVSWDIFGAQIVLPYLLADTMIYGCIFGIVLGISHDMLDTRSIVKPNQGIERSLWYGIGTSLIYIIPSLVDVYLTLHGAPISIIIVLFSGFFAGLVMGGYAAFQHGLLRLFLWRAKCIPFAYIHFLDYATSRILLRKIGGSYIFAHRLLLDYFATLPLPNTVPAIPFISEGMRTQRTVKSSHLSKKSWIILVIGILLIFSLVTSIAIPLIYPIATAQAYTEALRSIRRTWNVKLEDPLAGNTKGYEWSQYKNCQFLHGSYHAINESQKYVYPCVAEATNFSRFLYEVGYTILKGDCAGLLFDEASNSQTFYILEVCQNGQYYLYRQKAAEFKRLSKGHPSALNLGINLWNTIDVLVDRGAITLYINDEFVSRVTDSTYTQGKIAVTAINYHQPTEVAYGHVTVWTPPEDK